MRVPVEIVQADYGNPIHAAAIVGLLDAYARDPMGGGAPLLPEVREHIVAALASRPHAISLIAFADHEPVGLVNCFEGFSTFACQPLINIHDFVVLETHRGRGISQTMLAAVEALARARGCCKVTLEVLSGNTVAKAAYEKFGFRAYTLDERAGSAVFWQKHIGQ